MKLLAILGGSFTNEGRYRNLSRLHFQRYTKIAGMVLTILLVDSIAAQPIDSFSQYRLLCALEYEVDSKDWELSFNDSSLLLQVVGGVTNASAERSLLILKSECLIKLKRFEDARILLNELNNSIPNEIVILDLLGRVHIFLGNFDMSVNYLNKIIEQEPYLLADYYFKSFAERMRGNIDGAEETLLEGMRISKTDVNTQGPRYAIDEVMLYMALSDIYLATRRNNDAIDLLREGLNRNSMSDELFDKLADTYLEDDDIKEIEDLESLYCDVNFSERCI